MNRHVLKMILLTAAVFLYAVLFVWKNDANDKEYSVALVPAEGMTILSSNPVTVHCGESAGFEVVFSEGYSCGNTADVRYENGYLYIDNVRASRSVFFMPQKECMLLVGDGYQDMIELIGEAKVYSGDKASVRVHPPLHYSCESLIVNGTEYPVPAGNVLSFPVFDDSVLSLTLRGEPVSVTVVSVANRFSGISGLKEEYRYGDTLNLKAEYDGENAVFKGWSTQAYLKDGGTLMSLQEELSLTIDNDIEIFANFSDSKSYTVYIDPNGAEHSDTLVISGDGLNQSVELPADNIGMVREGYTLVGYNTKPDASGTHYSLSAPVLMSGSDMMLYAEWVKNTPADALTYVVKDKTAVITGKKEEIGSVLCIPSRIDNVPVRSIAAEAFKGDKTLQTVVLPIGTAYIYDDAFSDCENLARIYLPDTIKEIGNGAFSSTDKLKSLRVLASQDARAYDRSFNAGYADRYARLKTAEGKRIILVSGSSGSFGLNSELLSEHYPDYSIINFSGSYQFGMRPISYYLMNNVHAGDVIIFAPEYYDGMYANELTGEIANWMYLESNLNMLEEMDLNEVRKSILDTYPKFLNERRKILPGKEAARSVLARANFNVYGDIFVERAHRNNTEPYKPDMDLIDSRGIEWFEWVFSDITSKGGTCLFSFPPVSDGEAKMASLMPAYEKYTNALKAAFESFDVTVISNAGDYVFAEKVFYDNRYHMTLDGANMRTLQLIYDLDAYFGIDR